MNHIPFRRVAMLGLLLSILSGAFAHAQSSCSSKSLKGPFGFSISGKIINSGVDCAITGRFEGDGKGQTSGTLTESAGGHVMRTPFKGTYSVNPDCTGSLRFNFPNGLSVGSAFVVLGDGSEMYFMNSDDASAVPVSVVDTGTIKRQHRPWSPPKKCSNADFNGAFGLSLSGTKVDSKTAFVTGGRVKADGRGHLAGTATTSVAGHISQGSLDGTYTINEDCTGSATLHTPARTTENFDIVLVDRGREVFLIGSDEGIQQTGSASKQLMPR